MANKKKFHGEDFNGHPLVGLPTPTTTETTAAANVAFVLANAGGGGSDPALENRVTALENKSSSIFTTFTDEFSDDTYVDASTTATLENGYIRALFQNKYREDFNNLYGIVQPNTSFYNPIDKIKRVDTPSNTEHSFTTNAMTNFAGGVTQVDVTPSVSLSTANTFSSDVTNSTHSTVSNIMPIKHIDEDGNEWTLRYSNIATSTGGAYLSASHINDGAETRIWPTSGNATTVADGVRNLTITSDSNYVYIAFYRTAQSLDIRMFDRQNGNQIGAEVNQSTTTPNFRGMDILVVGEKLYLLRTIGGSSTSSMVLTVCDISSSGLTFVANNQVYQEGTAGLIQDCKIGYDPSTNRMLCVAFRRASSNGVIIAVRSGVDGSQVTAASLINTSSYGNGSCVFHNGQFHILNNVNAQNGFSYLTVTTSGVASSVSTSDTSYSVSNYRFEMTAFGNTLHVVYGNSTLTSLLYSRFDISSGFSAIDTNQLFSFTEIRRVHVFGVDDVNESFKVIAEEYNTNYDVFSYQEISETLHIEIRNSANNAALSDKTAYASGTLTLELNTPANDFRVRFYVQLGSLIPQQSNFEMEYFEVEATDSEAQISNPTSSDFVSTVIFNDRVVDTIFLSPIVSNEANGSFVWQISTVDGVWETLDAQDLNTFKQLSIAGSQVRVKAIITRNSNVTSLSEMPRIESYQLSTKNVITPNDLLPLQINMLKMGLKINALGTYSTTEFVKMMVDLFEDDSNIDPSSTATFSAGTYTADGSNAVLISEAETTSTNDGVATVTSAIVMAEYTGTVNFYVRRGSGSWGNQITLGEIVQFSQGTPTDEIQIKAEMSPGAVLYGWAYLYQ